MANSQTAQEVIEALNLSPHPEKGWYIETFRDDDSSDNRPHSTCIYYLLEGEAGLSKWHRVLDAVEVWHYYAGAPMQLSLSWDDGKPTRDLILGADLAKVSKQPPHAPLSVLRIYETMLNMMIRANAHRLSSSVENGNMRKA
jgi:predicted cupin superfamily sugar epimerase